MSLRHVLGTELSAKCVQSYPERLSVTFIVNFEHI